MGCCRFQRHFVKVVNETGGGLWEQEGNSAGNSRLKQSSWSPSAGLVLARQPGTWMADALMMAVWRRGRPVSLLHHSDQGSQYTSEHFQPLQGITWSMSRAGEVWDNSAMESFFSSLKTERTARKVYRSREQARPMCSITLNGSTTPQGKPAFKVLSSYPPPLFILVWRDGTPS